MNEIQSPNRYSLKYYFKELSRIKKLTFNRRAIFLSTILILGGLLILKIVMTPKPLLIGIYDPSGNHDSQSKFRVQNLYITWDENLNNVSELIKKNNRIKRIPIITIEPWQKVKTEAAGKELLGDINSGKYDGTIVDLCKILSTSDLSPILRWGHEMELKNSRYPWTNQDPQVYKLSYQRFVKLCRQESSRFKFMWSPAGEQGSDNYWPGDNYVDFIGLSVYSFDEWDKKYIGHQRSFSEVLQPKYDLIKKFDKPLIVAESGVTGAPQYQKEWIRQLVRDRNNFKLLEGFLYFDSIDRPGAWGTDLGTADFRISDDSLAPLLEITNMKYNLD